MNVKITKLKVLLTDGADEIHGEFGELEPLGYLLEYPPGFKMLAGKGKGENYCQRNFPGVPLEVINGRN